MIEAAFIGALFGLGIILLIRGANPPEPTLQERIGDFEVFDRAATPEDQSIDDVRRRLAVRVLELVRSESIDDIRADVAVAQMSYEAYAIDKLNAGVGVGLLVAAVAGWFGIANGPTALLVLGVLGALGGYWIPDLDMKKKAVAGRLEFEKALNAFVGLVSVSMTGGGGLNTAMGDAARVGHGWPFEALQSTLDDAALRGENSWTTLDRLGRRLQIEPLIELAGALALAGNSGARITETLMARAESGRKKEIADAREQAERTSANLGIPVGTLVIGWIGFLGFPAVVSLVAGFGG